MASAVGWRRNRDGPWAFRPRPWGRPGSLVARRPRPGGWLRPDGQRHAGRAWRASGRTSVPRLAAAGYALSPDLGVTALAA